jgi:hypothetical protein
MYTEDINPGTGRLNLGENFFSNEPFSGAVDEIRVYTRDLSRGEVRSLYLQPGQKSARLDGGTLVADTVSSNEANLTDIFAQTLTLNNGGRVDGGDTDFRHDKGLVGEADAGGADASGVRWYEAANPSNTLDAAITPRTRGGTFASLHAYSETQLILEGAQNTAISGNLMSIPQRMTHPDKAELQALPGGGTNRLYIYIRVQDGFFRTWGAWLEEQSDGTYTFQKKEIGLSSESWNGLFADVSSPPPPSPPDDGSDDGTIQ